MKKLVLLAILLFPSCSFAAVAVGSSTSFSGPQASNQTSLSGAFNNVSGTYMTAEVSLKAPNLTNITGIGCTYNSVSMTSVRATSTGTGSNDVYIAAFSLNAPATGSNTLACSWTGNANYADVGTLSFTGAGATSGLQLKTSTASNAPALTVTSTANSIVVDGLTTGTKQVATAGATQTQIWQFNASADNFSSAGSYKTGAASTAMSWSWATNDFIAYVAFSVDPPVAAPVANTQICLSLYCFFQ